MRDPLSLDESEIEECIDGSSSVYLIREILEKIGVTRDGYVDVDEFADMFAYGIEGFIDAEYDTTEWHKSWDINREWAVNIAENINELISQE